MPLIEKEDRREQESLRIRLQPAVAEQLKSYCQFVDSSEQHVVNAALQRLFAADKEFRDFLETPPVVTPTEIVATTSSAGKRTKSKRQDDGESTLASSAESNTSAA
jgi:hypothetical protein